MACNSIDVIDVIDVYVRSIGMNIRSCIATQIIGSHRISFYRFLPHDKVYLPSNT